MSIQKLFACALLALAVVPATAVAEDPPTAVEPVPGLPPGAAVAALRSEPKLPVPKSWPFRDAFSRTSGTGRMIGGAFEWTDWVYDAYGAQSTGGRNPVTASASSLAPAQGQYVYPEGKAAGNGADIFRAAVGLERSASVWRVDWNTLADASIPIAAWAFDTDDDAATGGATWPASANVSSPGIDKALVVSAQGARLVDVVSGETIATFPTRVDMQARSFLVRVPRKTLPVTGRWRVRLGAGLADATGTAFAVPTRGGGDAAPESAPRLYNVTFRTAAQEPPTFTGGETGAAGDELSQIVGEVPGVGGYGEELPNTLAGNFWAEDNQAGAIAAGDVSAFSQVVDWGALARKRRTDPPLLKGWSARWLANDLDLGQGVADAHPFYVGRVQPYAVYVPRGYDGKRPAPLTWALHSAQGNYLQYAALNPRMTEELCETRGSICVTTNGFGGGALYGGDVSEHEVWQVWRQIALGYRVAPDRTVVTGYSAGGVGTYRMSHSYPSVFSAAMPLDGGFEEACSSAETGPRNFVIALAPDRSGNVHWVPQVVSSAVADELSLYPAVVEQVQRFRAAGNRFSFFSTTSGEHIVSAIADGFATQIRALGGTPRAKQRPGTIDYGWCPQVVDAELGLGPASVYWLSGLSQRTADTRSAMSRVVADNAALPEPETAQETTQSVVAPADSPPMHVLTNDWKLGPTPAARRNLELELTNVKTLTVDTVAAKLPSGVATVTTDGPTSFTLARLPRGTRVKGPGGSVTAGRTGRITVQLGEGTTELAWSRSRGSRR